MESSRLSVHQDLLFMNPFLCYEDWLKIDCFFFSGQKASYIWFSAPKEEDFRVFFDMSSTKDASMSWVVHAKGSAAPRYRSWSQPEIQGAMGPWCIPLVSIRPHGIAAIVLLPGSHWRCAEDWIEASAWWSKMSRIPSYLLYLLPVHQSTLREVERFGKEHAGQNIAEIHFVNF